MFARVVSAHAPPDKLDQGIDLTRSMEHAWQQQKGFQGANQIILADFPLRWQIAILKALGARTAVLREHQQQKPSAPGARED
jgi:hypothetical protein